MRVLHRLLADAVELAIPSSCLGCSRAGAGRLSLCPRCAGRVKRLRPPRCRTCGRGLGAAAPPEARCGPCRRRPPALDRLWAVWSYEPPLDAVLRGLKFRHLEVLGDRLAGALIEPLHHQALETLGGDAPELPRLDWVVPVPLHWRRRLARGYNQAEAIARPLARRLGLPCRRALARPRATLEQARLGREHRWTNVRRAFRARRRLENRSVLLVDDVTTTGATLDAAARALKRAGARRVVGLAVARTPDPGEP